MIIKYIIRFVAISLCLLLSSNSFIAYKNGSPKITWEEAKYKASQIVNFYDLNFEKQHEIVNNIYVWENESEEYRQIPFEGRLPYSLMKLTNSSNESYMINPSPFKKNYRSINWLPNLNMFYELAIVHHQMYELYGSKKTPPMFLILALLSHETLMRDVLGDHGLSTGMCQLYRPTARYITKGSRNRKIFNKLIYFDKKGHQHFYTQRKMLEFIYHFLILEKGYSNQRKHYGVAKYNGGGERARKYGKTVLLKSLYYQAVILALKSKTPVQAARELAEWNKSPLPHLFINAADFSKEGGGENTSFELSEEELNQINIFKYSLSQYALDLREKQPDYSKQYRKKNPPQVVRIENNFFAGEAQNLNQIDALSSFEREREHISKGCYFKLKEGRTIFSYLRENTFDVMFYDNGFRFYTYDLEETIKKDTLFLTTPALFEQKVNDKKLILSEAITGDTVYVRPGLPIYQIAKKDIFY